MAFRYATAWPPSEPDSWPDIVQIFALTPGNMFITSTQRDGSSDYHDFGMAADGARDMDAAGEAAMRDCAQFLYPFAEYFLELIHTTPYDTDNGFYVKNGEQVGPDYYGPQTVADHRNHVHVAMSSAGARDLLTVLRGQAGPGGPPDPPAGTGEVWGRDSSNHDWDRGPMNLVAERADGSLFHVAKVGGIGPTEGGRYQDPFFAEAMRRGMAAGFPVLGDYFVCCPTQYASVGEQVGYWISLLDQGFPAWRDHPMIHQLDAESWEAEDQGYPASWQDCRDLLTEFSARVPTGYKIWYAPRRLYDDAPDIGFDIWTPDYHTNGRGYRELYPGDDDFAWGAYSGSGRAPRIFQYASDALMGDDPQCDANKFRGSLDDLLALTGRRPTPTTRPRDEEDEMPQGMVPKGKTASEVAISSAWDRSVLSVGCTRGKAKLRIGEHKVDGEWTFADVTVSADDLRRHDMPPQIQIDMRSVTRIPHSETDKMDAPVTWLLYYAPE
ncbi:hypothetical protein R8Z50_25575 [Longispora sp. K20-0274]|uniref:hypothetical protein n=1 Tax=Longispora sp. K20-0274 TaxID=3088255 RepID=UPI00399B280C